MELVCERVERVAADLLVVPCFAAERPLRGAAGRVDWRLCGLLIRLLEQRGRAGSDEALLLVSGGRLRSERVLLLELGPRETCDARRLHALARSAALRAAELRVGRLALALPGESGAAPASQAAAARALVDGIAAGLRERPFAVRLRLLAPPEQEASLSEVLRQHARQGSSDGVRLLLESPPAPGQRGAAPSPDRRRPPRSEAGVPAGGDGPGRGPAAKPPSPS